MAQTRKVQGPPAQVATDPKCPACNDHPDMRFLYTVNVPDSGLLSRVFQCQACKTVLHQHMDQSRVLGNVPQSPAVFDLRK